MHTFGYAVTVNFTVMDLMWVIAVAFVVSAVVAAFLLPNIVRVAAKNNLYDQPDERHVHMGKVPRLGGVAFLPAMFMALIVALVIDTYLVSGVNDAILLREVRQMLVAGTGLFILYFVGLADDLSGVPYRNKFIAQILAASLMCASGVWVNNLRGFLGIYELSAWVGVPLTIFLVVLVINSINLIDGIDGLAAGVCITGMIGFSFVFIENYYYSFAVVTASALGCLIPFYIFNVFGKTESRKIFLGDTGTLFMGYLLAFFAVKITMVYPAFTGNANSFYLVYAYSLLLLPVFDVIRVFLGRISRHHNPFLPDRSHIHHKLLSLGMTARAARIIIFSVAVFFFVVNVTMSYIGLNINLIVLLDVVIWTAGHVLLSYRIRRHHYQHGIVLSLTVVAILSASCSSVKDVAYLQNRVIDNSEKVDRYAGVIIQPMDILSIVVSSRNPELAAMFNLPVVTFQEGSEVGLTGGYGQKLMGYMVDEQGMIDFPVLGKIKAAGMTRWELSENIKRRLVKDGYLSEAVVTVEFMNFKVSVIGEVASPGTFSIEGDKVNVLQALAMAKDLTIYGRRDNVLVIREQDGRRVIYQINLLDVDMFKSPAYYLQQNDVVYVEPNSKKARQSTIDDKNLRLTSIAVSSASVLLSLVTLIVNLIN